MKENLAQDLHIDFLSGKMRYRAQHAGLRSELIARAMGSRPQDHPSIIDATAGLGRDSFILATLGFEITLLERSEVLYHLLDEALKRAQPALPEIIARMQLIHADAIQWLKALPEAKRPDIIYLDPMFPERKKSASVKKEMAIMQELLGKDTDHALLFTTALACAKRRVVVKRPRLAPKIAEKAVNFSLSGKTSRFDIYLI
jgi:16S rRNA (guanine1516-N2)-methyltransferase